VFEANNAASLIEFRVAYLRAIAKSWSDPEFRTRLSETPIVALGECGLGRWTWRLDLKLPLDGDQWNPGDTGGWAGSNRESITLYLPLDPAVALPGPPSESWPEALSEYYRLYPTLLGTIGEPSPAGQAYNVGLGSWNAFLDFGSVTVRALALAWRNADFRTQVQKDTIAALQNWLGYNSPWNLDIRIRNNPEMKWSSGVWQQGSRKNELCLFVPQRPGDDFTVWPIALAAYNETGPAYPFTCCT
jgi:ribosomally synthesized peptide (two-chain TOMM family)